MHPSAGTSSGRTGTPAQTGIPICVGNPLSRFNLAGQIQNTGSLGSFQVLIDTEAVPLPTGGTTVLIAGQTFHFQVWFRDGSSSVLTDGTAVTFH